LSAWRRGKRCKKNSLSLLKYCRLQVFLFLLRYLHHCIDPVLHCIQESNAPLPSQPYHYCSSQHVQSTDSSLSIRPSLHRNLRLFCYAACSSRFVNRREDSLLIPLKTPVPTSWSPAGEQQQSTKVLVPPITETLQTHQLAYMPLLLQPHRCSAPSTWSQ